MEIDKSLLISPPGMMANFVLELTDKCNLRCLYCHQNRPDFVAKRFMSEKMIERVMEYFVDTKPPYINLTGGGELTVAPGWEIQCKKFLDSGIPLVSTVNLARILTPKEAEVLARFKMLTVSIDSVDRETLKQYRKSVDIRTISNNILMIKGAANRLGIRGPEWIISAVYYIEITGGLTDVAAYAAAVGANVFALQDLLEYDSIANNVTPVWKLRGQEAVKVVKDTRNAIDTAKELGLAINLPGDFMERLNQLERNAYAAAA